MRTSIIIVLLAGVLLAGIAGIQCTSAPAHAQERPTLTPAQDRPTITPQPTARPRSEPTAAPPSPTPEPASPTPEPPSPTPEAAVVPATPTPTAAPPMQQPTALPRTGGSEPAAPGGVWIGALLAIIAGGIIRKAASAMR